MLPKTLERQKALRNEIRGVKVLDLIGHETVPRRPYEIDQSGDYGKDPEPMFFKHNGKLYHNKKPPGGSPPKGFLDSFIYGSCMD
jgi:hypothetical protein